MNTASDEAVMSIEIGSMADDQFAGLCHFAGTYGVFGIKQTAGIRRLVYDNYGQDKEGKINAASAIYLKSFRGLS